MQFSGSLVALITPFDKKGRIDRKALAKLIEWHIAEGTDGIVCSATTGEGPTLSNQDRKTIAQVCVETASKRIPIIVSTGTNDTRQSILLTEQAQKLGADGCLVVTPYYNKPTQRGCFLHFNEVGKVGLPIVLYHNPPRAACKLTAETIAEIAQIPSVVAIKESSHDLELVRRIIKVLPVLSGDDDMALDIMKEGGIGCIGVTPNLIPKGWKKMIQLCLQKKWEEAQILADKMLPLSKTLFLETNPQGIKYALSWFNKCQPVLRLPLILPSEAIQQEIKKAIIRLALPLQSMSAVE